MKTLDEKIDSILGRLDSIEQEISKMVLREFVQQPNVTFVPSQQCTCGRPGTAACPRHGYLNNVTIM